MNGNIRSLVHFLISICFSHAFIVCQGGAASPGIHDSQPNNPYSLLRPSIQRQSISLLQTHGGLELFSEPKQML